MPVLLLCRPPDAMGEHIGLLSRTCQPLDSLQLLDEQLRERLRQQVPGWRIQNNAAGTCVGVWVLAGLVEVPLM